MPKTFEVIGMPPDRVLKKLSRDSWNMIKKPISDGGKLIQKRGKEMASNFKRSGNYRKSIRRKTVASRRSGEISATVGVITSSPAFKYAAKVEHKHHVFSRLEHEFKNPTIQSVKSGLRNGLRTYRIRGTG
jgi:hypothetical protein